jgi:hypothetical protein
MEKLSIVGSEFSDTDLEFQVCSHLLPILELLEASGNKYNHSDPLSRDKYSESKRVVEGPIDFHLISETFEIPPFLSLSPTKSTVFCQRCWCSIVESD